MCLLHILSQYTVSKNLKKKELYADFEYTLGFSLLSM